MKTMTSASLSATVHVAKALAHASRLRILAMLSGGELCVCQMTAVLRLAPSTVSAHLSDLRRSGLVVERKDAKWVLPASPTMRLSGGSRRRRYRSPRSTRKSART
jgi:DNA-binding transcriptional ArsR family regulator